jgi:tryptophan-rich sensory protein
MKKSYFIIPLVTIAVSVFGSRLTSQGMDWYNTLNLHPLTPPGALIGMVWTLIFVYTTFAAWAVVKYLKGRDYSRIMRLFGLNALLNIAWSWIFFVQHWSLLALIEMGVLWLVTFTLFLILLRKLKLAAWLLLPYLIRVLLASFFAYQVVILN